MRNKTWLVFRMQVRMLVFNTTFVVILLSMPLLSVFSVVGIDALNLVDDNRAQVDLAQLDAIFGLGKEESLPVGFVDASGLVRQVPDDFSMRVFEDEAAARAALQDGSLDGYYVLEQDYVRDGRVTYYDTENRSLAWFMELERIEQLANYNLLAGDGGLWERFETPLAEMKTTYLTREAQVGLLNMLSMLVPVGMAMLFYLTISSVASLLFESLVMETSNQTIEVLMTSLSMRQLLIGKVLALGLIGLLLEVCWVGLSALGFGLTGMASQFALPITLTSETFLWGLVFFLLGYAIYAAVITSVGALVQRLREQWQLLLLIMLPLFIPLLYLMTNTTDLNTPGWLFLSLFPLTSPVAMFSRLILSDVPAWQVALSILILAASSILVLRLAVRMFRAQYLLAPHPWQAVRQFGRSIRTRLVGK